MLVKELIKELKKYPNDFTVQINKGISVDILKVERDIKKLTLI